MLPPAACGGRIATLGEFRRQLPDRHVRMGEPLKRISDSANSVLISRGDEKHPVTTSSPLPLPGLQATHKATFGVKFTSLESVWDRATVPAACLGVRFLAQGDCVTMTPMAEDG
ncbi:MAG TPA: hypothetical protein VMY37_05405 [Thermoguttaceae bacterium]|nr:hypothetical protein [Thermoguttaceae bacterium]